MEALLKIYKCGIFIKKIRKRVPLNQMRASYGNLIINFTRPNAPFYRSSVYVTVNVGNTGIVDNH